MVTTKGNVTAGVYLELSEKYTNSAVQKFFFELLRQLTRQSQTDYDGCN